MTTTKAHAEFGEAPSARPEEQDLRIPHPAEISAHMADKLRQAASHWLTWSQREFHDALFAQDGSDPSLDRYASARAELDSAEAWALSVARALRGGRG
jgi:hypothetical protein